MEADISGLHLVHDRPLAAATITTKNWLMRRSDGEVLGRYMRLLPSGHIGGCSALSEWRWEIRQGNLVFLDAIGCKAITFNTVYLTEAETIVLQGTTSGAKSATYSLHERPALSQIAEDASKIHVFASKNVEKRRNLVVLRANESSLHHTWGRDIADEDRNWDLCVSFYGKDENFSPTSFAEYHVLQNQDQKWTAIHNLMYKGSPLWDYDYLMFPDDDLMMSWSNVNKLFETSQSFGLQLAQPSLLPESYRYHNIVVQNNAFRLRFTNFVEIMTPIFSRYALEICVPTFVNSPRGFGLDFIWPSQLGDQPGRIAIIDEVAVLHGRPVGGNYDVAQGNQEMNKVMNDYGCVWDIKERGAIVRT